MWTAVVLGLRVPGYHEKVNGSLPEVKGEGTEVNVRSWPEARGHD